MRPWCDEAGKVMRFWRPHNQVVSGKKSPKNIGGEDNLYSVSTKLIEDPQYFENKIMTETADTPAAPLIKQITESGCHDLTLEDKQNLSMFIILLISRNPNTINKIKSNGENNVYGKLMNTKDELYKISPEYYDEKFSGMEEKIKGIGEYLALHSVLEFVVNSPLVPAMSSAHWQTIHTDGSDIDFVLGNRPVLGGKNFPEFDWGILPIAPRRLLFISRKNHTFDTTYLQPEFQTPLSLLINRTQFQKANDFVIAKDLGPNSGFKVLAEQYMPSRSNI